MSLLTAIILVAASAVGILAVLVFQSLRIKSGKITPTNNQDLRTWWQAEVDLFYSRFSSFFKNLSHLVSYFSLVVMHQVAVASRQFLMRVEGRFSRMVHSLQGRGNIGRRGAVSLYLSELKAPQTLRSQQSDSN